MLSEKQMELIQIIESNTGLQFRENPTEGNLCFAQNNLELQDEYKLEFNLADLNHYLKSFSETEISLPKDSTTFWKLVKKGRGLKKNKNKPF